MTKLSNDIKQSKLCELANLIMQYNNGETQNINVDEYEKWVLISGMLNHAEIEENLFDDFLLNPTHYFIEDSEIVLNENWKQDEFDNAKDSKLLENTTKAKATIENGYVVYKDAQFETNSQTVSDLTATMLIMQAGTIEKYSWLSKDDKVVELTVDDFALLGDLIAQFKNAIWNVLYINYKNQIEKATTVEEIEAIVIEYDIPEILKTL